MAMPIASNPISLGQIQAEFGGSSPIQISEYYRQPSGLTSPNNTNVPTSGTIKFSDFYSAFKAASVDIRFSRESSITNHFYLNSPGFEQIDIFTDVDGSFSLKTYFIPRGVTFRITSGNDTGNGTLIRTNFSSLYGTTGMQLEDSINIPGAIDYNDLEWYPDLGTVYQSGDEFYYVLNT